MPDVRQNRSCAIHARERADSASCNHNRASPRAASKRRTAALRATLVITFAVAATAACSTGAERIVAQPPGQQTCNVAGKFCDTFFGP
ncbi:hypothetical protein OKW42_000546 [Paraburkholderia sp. WC7.3d]|uniref:Lipoprotein n=1 Tax=Paraburkholderia podalyriae TaxID=1938811 RepID=A0ABR7PMD5_9BURK|nr:hypothetical protein [Paraburkholderia podalyriae]